MLDFDVVEKLRERANVSYEDAKAALEACGGDLLEALIYLEKQGKVPPPQGGSYTSKTEEPRVREERAVPPKQEKGESFTDILNRFFRWCGRVLHTGNTNYFEVQRHDESIISVPITVLVLLVFLAFWVTIPLLIVGLFLGCRYSFSGSKIKNIDVNGVMDSAANAAEALKHEVMGRTGNNEGDNNGDK